MNKAYYVYFHYNMWWGIAQVSDIISEVSDEVSVAPNLGHVVHPEKQETCSGNSDESVRILR